MALKTIRVSGTTSEVYYGFTYSDGVNTKTIPIFPNNQYFISPVDTYTTDPNLQVNINANPVNTYYNFSGCCSGETFSIYTYSNTNPLIVGNTYWFNQVLSITSDDYLSGCFTLVSSSSTSPSYTLYSALNRGSSISTYVDCSTCNTAHTCPTSACCLNIQVDCQNCPDYTISLTPDGYVNDAYFYQFNNLSGDVLILYYSGSSWILSNATSAQTVSCCFGTTPDCPSGSTLTNSYGLLCSVIGNDTITLVTKNCTPPPLECSPMYCIQETGLDYDDTYTAMLGDEYNGTGYWSGQSNGYVIYYSSADTQWCLSTTLGGTCLMSGKSPCISTCPDLCEHYFSEGICPYTTTTTTIDCSTFDFTAIFDCEVFPTTTTTTSTSTTTTTTTLPPNPCSGVSIDASIVSYTTTTTTSTSTTTTTTINYPCNFSGDVSFNVIDVEIKCPISKEFKDCYDMGGTRYYTNDILINPSSGTVEVDMVFSALVDGEIRCISYVGINNDVSPMNSITLLDGPYGTYPYDCSLCFTSTTTTTTSTSTTTTTTQPPCYCYALVSSKSNEFTYTDCSGTTQTIEVTINDQVVFICSRTEPIYDETKGTATISESCPSSPNDCTLPPCYCYNITNTYGEEGSINYVIIVDCEGSTQLVPIYYGETLYICSRIKPTSLYTGLTSTIFATNCDSCGI